MLRSRQGRAGLPRPGLSTRRNSRTCVTPQCFMCSDCKAIRWNRSYDDISVRHPKGGASCMPVLLDSQKEAVALIESSRETMNGRKREFAAAGFLLLLTLAAMAAATLAVGQDVAPAVGQARSRGVQGAASIPDFSGIWAHLTWPDFEPPVGGPGPVTNRSRRNGVSDVYELVGDYTNVILKPHAAEVVKQRGEISLTRMPYPTPSNQCWPGGVPFVLYNIGMQMLQEPVKITILYSNDHEVRHVRMNKPHPVQLTPTWYGDSVGRYEGDTLVIDTVGIKIGPFAMLDMYGTPHSPAL